MKIRLDHYLVAKGLVESRSQAESYIRLGMVKVNGQIVTKTGFGVGPKDKVVFSVDQQYVSRAGLKLASVADGLELDFTNKTVLDVGSSTGGFTDFVLSKGAQMVIAVDVGTEQMHPRLRSDKRVELHEQTDIRDFMTDQKIDVVVIDVSFVSIRDILPDVNKIAGPSATIVAMIKPQFEAGKNSKNKGVIKNDKMRREILKDFENWANYSFKILAKADSKIPGEKGNLERFYVLSALVKH